MLARQTCSNLSVYKEAGHIKQFYIINSLVIGTHRREHFGGQLEKTSKSTLAFLSNKV